MPVGNQLWFPTMPGSSPVFPSPATAPITPISAPTANPSTYSPAYGGIPQIPNPTSTAGNAIGGNIQNMAALLQQILGASGASAAGAQAQVAANLPGYAPMTQQASTDILSNLQGVVPQDVQNQIAQSAAERGINVGVGSPNSNAALLRAMGLTSLGQQTLGQQQLTAAIGRTPIGPAQNPANFLVTPEQQQAAAAGQAYLNAAPIPAAAAAARMQELLAGLNAGQNGYGGGLPSPSGSPAAEIAQRYAPTYSGTQQGLPNQGQGNASDYITFSDGTIVDATTGEVVGYSSSQTPDQTPAGTVTTPDYAYAPGSPGSYYPQDNTFSDQAFYDLGGF